MRKSNRGMLLAFVLVLGTILAAQTAQTVASGWCGYAQWTLMDEGVLRVHSDGAMKNYINKTEMPWYQYADQIEEVVSASGSGAGG